MCVYIKHKVKNFNIIHWQFQMDQLEGIYKKLHTKIEILQYVFLIGMLIIILITSITLYTLKVDIKESIDRLHDEMYQEHCHMGRGI